MSATMRHVRAADVMSANGVNRVNRPSDGAAPPGDHRGSSKSSGGLVWRNIGALKALLGRAERELAREPGAYVAVAVVAADKHEEQVGRWGWAGTADTGGKVADIGNRLAGEARGLRVRAHHDGGRLLGSVLLRRARLDGAPPPDVVKLAGTDAGAERRLAALEAQLAQALGRIQEQEREIRSLRGEVARVEHLPNAVGNMHRRLDAVEAACERMEDAEATRPEGEEEEEAEEEEGDEGDFEDEEDDNDA